MIINQLQKLDLTKNEAKVYLALLELGETSVIRIGQKTNLKRTTVYGLIDNLKKKGYLEVFKKGNKNSYVAKDPQEIVNKLKQKQQIADDLLPELLSVANFIDKKPKIKFFEGKQSIQEIHNDILKYPNQEYVAWMSELLFVQHYDRDYWYKYFAPERKKRKIWYRAILPKNEKTENFQKEDKENLRQTKVDNSSEHEIKVNIIIYGKNKIAILSTDDMIGLILESEKIHITMKTIFEVYWKSLSD